MAKAILILNAQNDFVSAFPEGRVVAENIAEYVKKMAGPQITVFNVQDTHYDLPPQRSYPWPLIGHYGHELCPLVSGVFYDTYLIYKDIYYVMKVKPCAEEALAQMRDKYDDITIMGLRGADVRETAIAIRDTFPAGTKITLATGGITLDWPVEKMMDEGWNLIVI